MISDYSTLQQAIADWLARADLTAQIPTFISLAEARMNKDIRVRQMQNSATGTVASGGFTLPTDCRGIQSLRISYGNTSIEIPPLTPQALKDDQSGVYPIGYVVQGSTCNLIGGQDGQVYTLNYWQAIPALSSSSATNWLILREPGAYLYASLLEASPYLRDNEMAIVWTQQYKDIIANMHADDERTRYGSGAAMRINSP